MPTHVSMTPTTVASITMPAPNAPSNSIPPSGANIPQVVVRAGKTYVCSACGTLVEIPAEFVGQIMMAPECSEEREPPTNDDAPAEPSPKKPAGGYPSPAKDSPRRSFSPKACPERERIDGLIVPTTGEMERLLAWIDYRLKRIDALKRLEEQLSRQKTAPMPRRRPHRPAKRVPLRRRAAATRRHAHADVSMAPEFAPAKERGPP